MSVSKNNISILVLSSILSSCSSAIVKTPEAINSASNYHKIAVVECMLPDQVRKLSENILYFSPAHPIKTSQPDCKFRGGQII